MKIEATSYEREDGMALLRHKSDKWVIRRRISGPTQFLHKDPVEGFKWVLCLAPGFNLDDMALPFEKAFIVFQTFPVDA